ncbi:hypothetical protein GGD83_004879 [Rhodoblastus sphagnicola]|nr:hypothetical protein [Rhodoblastus sphagnicola]
MMAQSFAVGKFPFHEPAILIRPPAVMSCVDLIFDFGRGLGLDEDDHERSRVWDDQIGGDCSDMLGSNQYPGERQAVKGTGRLYGIGLGPGAPERLAVKATRLLKICPVVAYFCKSGRRGNARAIADCWSARSMLSPAPRPSRTSFRSEKRTATTNPIFRWSCFPDGEGGHDGQAPLHRGGASAKRKPSLVHGAFAKVIVISRLTRITACDYYISCFGASYRQHMGLRGKPVRRRRCPRNCKRRACVRMRH